MRLQTCWLVWEKFKVALKNSNGEIISLGSLHKFPLETRLKKFSTVIRPAFGTSFMLSCLITDSDMLNQNSSSGLPTWMHYMNLNFSSSAEDHINETCTFPLCYLCSCPTARTHYGSFEFSQDITRSLQPSHTPLTLFTLTIRRAIQLFAGEYDCIQAHKGIQTSTKYLVSPVYKPEHIFQPPMRNATACRDDSVEFQCYTQFNWTKGPMKEFMQRFIWYHPKLGILYAPSDHPVKGIALTESGVIDSNATFSFEVTQTGEPCSCRSTITISRAAAQWAGQIECWFQIDTFLDEWIRQSAYLILKH